MEHTVCPRSLDPIYVVTHSIQWDSTSWTYSGSSSLLGVHSGLDLSYYRVIWQINLKTVLGKPQKSFSFSGPTAKHIDIL